MTVTIRDCTTSDLAAVTRIYANAVLNGTASFELDPPDSDEMTRRHRTLVVGGCPYLVAHDAAGAVLGYAYAAPFRPRPAYRYTVEDSVYVAPDAQRHGVGRMLLKLLMERCTKAGFRQMIAVIGDPPRQAASIGLHTALGFRPVGTVAAVGYKHERWLDSIYMQCALGNGATVPPD